MKNFKYIILAAIALVFAGVSCSDGEEITKNLEIEALEVKITDVAQTKSIAVTVDKNEQFVAVWDGGDWGQVETTTTGVDVILAKNDSPEDRSGSVLIRLKSGWRTQVVKVIQYGNNPALTVLPEEVSFDFLGGDSKIEVTSSYVWEVQSEVEWLKIKEYPQSNTVVLTAEKNNTKIARSTILIVKSGRATKEILVKQDEGMFFILPYLEFANYEVGAPYDAFEKNRHSIKSPSARLYFTKSRIFEKIVYYHGDRELLATEALLSQEYGFDYFETDEFKNKVIEAGFEFISSASGDTYYWREDPNAILENNCMLQVSAGGHPHLIVLYSEQIRPEIAPDAESYAEYPYPPAELLWDSNMNDARNWEMANGGIVKQEDVNEISFSVPGSEIYHERIYGFNKAEEGGKLHATIHVWHNVEKVFTRGLFGYKINGKFEALLGAEGFAFIKLDPRTDPIYYNEAKNFYVIFSPLEDKVTKIKYTGAYYYEANPYPNAVGPKAKSYLYQPEYKTTINDYVRLESRDVRGELKELRDNTRKALALEGITLDR